MEPRIHGRAVRAVHVTTVPETLRFLTGQLRYLCGHGFSAHLVSAPGPLLREFADAEGVTWTAIPMERRITPAADLVALGRLVQLFRRLRPEIVHAHTPKGGLLGMIAARLANVQVRVYHIHGLPHVTSAGLKRRLLRSTERVSCQAATRVLCVSRSVREVVIAEGLCDADRIEVLAGGSVNGVDATGLFRPPSDAGDKDRARKALGLPAKCLVLGFVGRIVRDKGWGELATAWHGLRDRYPDVRFLVVGPFEKRDPVSDDVARLITSDPRITYVGVQWNTPPLYAAMDLVALPTYREGFPVVPLEAAAMALPVVATRIPGCVDAIEDGVTGTLVEPRNAPELERAIARYLSDERLRRLHGTAGRRRALESFSQEVIWRETLAFYRRLLKP